MGLKPLPERRSPGEGNGEHALRTRLAPTPSGYLHLGNAWSFTLAWLMARSRGGTVHLRIDDMDTERMRPEFLRDIFTSLAWLGLGWDTGPRDEDGFRTRYSQISRLPIYASALDRLKALRDSEGPLVYACACSRTQVKRDSHAAGSGNRYAGTCRHRALPLDAPDTALRLRIPRGSEVELADRVSGRLRLDPAEEAGDFVVRKRNGDPAYQLTSLVDDVALGTNLVVRGMDLLGSTASQLQLARLLGMEEFLNADFLHHGLIVADHISSPSSVAKLSKSAGDASLKSLREKLSSPKEIFGYFAALLGQNPAKVGTAEDLISSFDEKSIPTGPISWKGFLEHGKLIYPEPPNAETC